jgi:hypothetical protein
VLPPLTFLRSSPHSHSSGTPHTHNPKVLPTITFLGCSPQSHSSGTPHTHNLEVLPTLTFLRYSPHSLSSGAPRDQIPQAHPHSFSFPLTHISKGLPTLAFLWCFSRLHFSGNTHHHILHVLSTLTFLRCVPHTPLIFLRFSQDSLSSGVPKLTFLRCYPHSHSSGTPHIHIPQVLPNRARHALFGLRTYAFALLGKTPGALALVLPLQVYFSLLVSLVLLVPFALVRIGSTAKTVMLPEQDCQDGAAWMELPGQDCQDKAAKTGQQGEYSKDS